MKENLTEEVGDQSHLDRVLVEDCDDRRWGEGKVGNAQEGDLCGRRCHGWRADHSSCPMGTGPNRQSLDNTPSRRIGLAGARASGSHHSRGVEEVQEDSPGEGLQVCDNL